MNKNENKKIFASTHTKHLTMTYHKLPYSIHCKDVLNNIKVQFENNIAISKKNYTIVNIMLVKEPYDLEINTENKDKCHIHAYVELKNKIKIHKHANTAKLFVFRYEDQEYYPNISPCFNRVSYCKYMLKLWEEDEKYKNDEYWSSMIDFLSQDSLNVTIKDLGSNMSKYTKQDAREKLEKHDVMQQVKRRNVIDYIFNKLPESREKIDDFLINLTGLKYLAESYKENPNYLLTKKGLEHMIEATRKYSTYIYGIPNTAKTSIVCAAVAELEQQNSAKYLLVKINNYDETKIINKIDVNQYDFVFLLFDDVKPEKDEELNRTFLINLLSGNEMPTSLSCRYENAKFNKKFIKIFTNNVPFSKFIEKMREEYKVRIKEIEFHSDHVYSS